MDTINQTKITRPDLPNIVVRERLIKSLNPISGPSFVFISAPAGYGKTTLLANYLEKSKKESIWYRMDDGDADPASFFYFLSLAAPQQSKPMPLLTADYLPSLKSYARLFFEMLFSRFDSEVCLVLDDYHLLPTESPVHGLIADNLSVLPKEIQVIIASRQSPPGEYARLIANSHMQVIKSESLKFNVQECRAITRLKGFSSLPKSQLERLLEATDGWIAGMILLLQSGNLKQIDRITAQKDPPHLMVDYFSNEVFRRLNVETRDVLLKTSLLTQVTPESAQLLTSRKTAGQTLSDLAAGLYFTYRQSGESDYFQYHALFRGFLRSQAHASFERDQLQQLRLQAARIEQAWGNFDAALDLFAQAGDENAMSALICDQALTLVTQGRFSTLQNWIQRISETHRAQEPWLQYWYAQCLQPFNPPEALKLLDSAFEQFQVQNDLRGTLLSWCSAVDCYVYHSDRFTGLDKWIDWMDEWLVLGQNFPDELIEGFVACSMGNALFFRRSYRNEIGAWFERAWIIAQRLHDSRLLAQAGFSYFSWNLRIGPIEKSLTILTLLRQAIDYELISPILKITLKTYEAVTLLMLNQTKASSTILDETVKLAQQHNIHQHDALINFVYVYSALLRGNAEQSTSYLEDADKSLQTHPNLWNQSHYLYLKGWEQYLRLDFKGAIEYCEASIQTCAEAGNPFGQIMARIGLAQALFDYGKTTQAWQMINQVIDETSQMGSPLLEFHARFALAYFKLTQGVSNETLHFLNDVLTLGNEYNFIKSSIWWYPAMFELVLVTAINNGIEPEFVRNLIHCREFVPNQPPLTCKDWPWPYRIKCLGSFEIFKDDQLLEFGRKTPKKPLELLKALITFGGERVTEHRLIDALWPDSDGDTGSSALSTNVKRLRKLLGQDLIAVTDNSISLDKRRCWVDVWTFEALFKQFRSLPSNHNPIKSQILIKQLLDLYQGHFLSDLTDAFWFLSLREKLRCQMIEVLIHYGRLLEHQNSEEAIKLYYQGLELDPIIEEFYQGLIRSYQALGQRTQAIQAYQQCSKSLAFNLNIKPSKATEELFQTLLNNH